MFSSWKVVCLAGLGVTALSWASVGAVQGDEAPRVYDPASGVDLAFVGDRLAIATPQSLGLTNPDSGQLVPFFAPSGGVLPLLATTPGFLAGVTAQGEVVVFDMESRREIGRRPGGRALLDVNVEPTLTLAPGGLRFLVGDGGAQLFQVLLDSPLPTPIGYPGPGSIQDLGFDRTGALVALPSRWTWSPSTEAWSPGKALDFQSKGQKNRLAWSPGADYLAIFRHERPTLLELNFLEGVELGYFEVQDMVLDPSGSSLVVSISGAADVAGYGSGILSEEHELGSLKLLDAKTGAVRLSLPREGAALGPAEAADHRTLALGVKLVALGEGRFGTVDVVDHQGVRSLYLRVRNDQLVATTELALTSGSSPLHLDMGGGLLAVAYEEQHVDIFDVDSLSAESVPQLSVSIAAQADPTIQGKPPARDVFALSKDGNILAMCGPAGTLFFANPRTGWPNEVVSVNLPGGAGRPLAARFAVDGSLTVLTEDRLPIGEDVAIQLNERTLEPTFSVWSKPRLVSAKARVSDDGATRVALLHGHAGNLDIYRGAVTDGQLEGHLVARRPIGSAPLDALAISDEGAVAWARAGQIVQDAKLKHPEADSNRKTERGQR